MKTRIPFFLFIALALVGCPPSKPAQKPATTANPSIAAQPDDNIDFAAFLGRLRKAAQAHDVNTLATMMTPNFGYVLGTTPDQDRVGLVAAFQYWDEKNLWGELNGILSESFVPAGAFMVAPPQFTDQTAKYTGYRAGMQRVNGSWKFAYFVNG